VFKILTFCYGVEIFCALFEGYSRDLEQITSILDAAS
jgi:hypothetical protein